MTQRVATTLQDAPTAFAGLIADEGPRDIISGVAYSPIPAGRFVRLRADGTYELPSDDTGIIDGVSVYDPLRMASYPQGNPPIQAGDVFGVMRMGRIYMDFSGGTQVVGAQATCKDAAGTLATQGMSSASATSANAVRATGFPATFRSVRTDGFALVEVAVAAQ